MAANGWKTITVGTALSWLMKIILAGLLPYEIYGGYYLFALAACLSIVVSLIPAMVERNYRIHLPLELDFLITSAIFLNTFMGEWLKFYEKVWLFDKVLHFYGTAVTAILAFMVVYSLHYARKLRLTLPFIWVFTVVFAMAMGGMWEIFEFWVDNLVGTHMQNGLNDTMWDMIYDLAGGVIIAVWGVIYVRYSHPDARRRLARPLGEVFGRGREVDKGNVPDI
ncbi:MAG: hypothetical protein HY883_07830 [Deltaproteobacteria bacterium]|nr:hypothetical protein [Deltaproteobacteria bacterium]